MGFNIKYTTGKGTERGIGVQFKWLVYLGIISVKVGSCNTEVDPEVKHVTGQ